MNIIAKGQNRKCLVYIKDHKEYLKKLKIFQYNN